MKVVILIRVFFFVLGIGFVVGLGNSEKFITYVRTYKSVPAPTKNVTKVLSSAEKNNILLFQKCSPGESCARVSNTTCGCISINRKHQKAYRQMLKPFTTKSCPTLVPCAITTAPCPSSRTCADDR